MPAGRTIVRIASVLIFTAAALGLAVLGVSLMLGLGSAPLVVPRPEVPTASPSSKPTTAVSTTEQPVTVIGASDVDPYGNNTENPDQAILAFDGNPTTAWKTVTYRRADMSGKQGVGLMFDLGSSQQISAIQLNLVGTGSSVTVGAGDDPALAPEKFPVLAQATAAGTELRLRLPKQVRAQYVLVWFTQLPAASSGGYQGGITDIKVLS